MSALRFFARYLYVPSNILGLNALALYMMAEGYHYFWLGILILAAIGLSFLMERVLPYEEDWNQPHEDIGKDIAHGCAYEAGYLITLGLLLLISMNLPASTIWPRSWPIVVQFLLALLIADCVMTIIHYWSHKVNWLWKFHAIHHGVQRLYGFNGFVRHPLHQALDIVLGTVPLVLAGLPVPIGAMLGFAIVIQLILQHSNVDYRLGPFQEVLSIGPVHRLHHVNWTGEGDVNFGLFFTIWDWMLGSFKPKGDRMPSASDIGIQNCPHFPQDFLRQLVIPLEPELPCLEPSPADAHENAAMLQNRAGLPRA